MARAGHEATGLMPMPATEYPAYNVESTRVTKREQAAAALLALLDRSTASIARPEDDHVRALCDRFAFLAGSRRRGDAMTALWSERKDESRFDVIEAGESSAVRYIVVLPRNPALEVSDLNRWREWLWPGPGVPPTEIVYDCTEEVLHGKAKPILCDLTRWPARVFAIVPTQVERLGVTATQRVLPDDAVELEVAMLDAGGHAVRGPLPFHVALEDDRGRSRYEAYHVTKEAGSARVSIVRRSDGASCRERLIVRCQLNGLTSELPIERAQDAHAAVADATRTSHGLRCRWDPHPWLP